MSEMHPDEVVAQAATAAAIAAVDQMTTTTDEWSVQDLTPEELAGLQQIVGTEGGLGCCQDGEEAGLGDDDHGLEVTDGSTDES